MSKKHWETYFNSIRSQDWTSALESLKEILKKEPKNSQVHLKIGDVFQKAGEASSAVSAYHQSAWLLMKDGFAQKALAIYKIILRLDPDNSEAINKSKVLMMELETSKTKPPAVPVVQAELEEQKEGTPSEQMMYSASQEAESELEPETTIEPVSAFNMEDLIERTSQQDLNAPDITSKLDTGAVEEAQAFETPSFLSSVSKKEVKSIFDRLQPQIFNPGDKIVEEGDSGDSVYFISSGSARVVAHILGKEMELAVLSSGDAFGEVAFLTGRPRTASVIAIDKVTVREFNRIMLEEIFEKYPDVLKRLEDFYQSHVQDTLKKVKTSIKK